MANVVTVLEQSLPQFWAGIVLIQIFAVRLPLAAGGWRW
jgi:ABC-type dipeptide/oligopeptide/nickel transport system permease component